MLIFSRKVVSSVDLYLLLPNVINVRYRLFEERRNNRITNLKIVVTDSFQYRNSYTRRYFRARVPFDDRFLRSRLTKMAARRSSSR